ncbi:MAG TPA: hypothetical protein VFL90_19100 [Methylomirabilota bacterium]|nr:hypothetical protein [Methylomirabilota bacterium]
MNSNDNTNVNTNLNSNTNQGQPSASPRMDNDRDRDDMKKGQDLDKKTGLDRADQAAGEHGQQGRDNAREHQDQK